MAYRTPIGLLVVAVGSIVLSSPAGIARQRGPEPGRALPDFDIRDGRPAASATPEAAVEIQRDAGRRPRQARLHAQTGAIRVLDYPGLTVAPDTSVGAVRGLLGQASERLGLERQDLTSLELVRDYVSASTGLRHLVFSQSFDGIPVFGAVVSVHVAADGAVVRLASSAARGNGRSRQGAMPAATAVERAAANVRPDQQFAAAQIASAGGPRQPARFARGPFLRDVDAGLTWLPVDGVLRLSWQVDIEPDGEPQAYDVLVDAVSGDVLVRRNRVFYVEGSGRVLQSAATRAIDPRRPDEKPIGADGCQPPINHEFISLNAPFRDSATVLSGTGRLEGNNVHAFHLNASTEAPAGVFDGTSWAFDFPFNTPGSAATTLFYAVNFAHDFFYDLGFDEAAGNFQQDNFSRGGLGNDGVKAIARASGRNNATYQHAVDGSNPTISMFLWDGTNCWSQDVDGDGTLDLDGDYDFDIVLHEFHHGVSQRLNTSWTGNEAGAIGEGGGDFFAYSVNGNPTLAEYAMPGGLRSVNAKTYADWYCFLGIICSVHDNGQIFANALWDVRERFRTDGVSGSEAAAINESHQLYVDALKLSPPAPTMLDIRDAMLLADQIRNPGTPNSQNYCRLWESFAARGMGLSATDTADNGFNQVGADYSVPDGCVGPPPPPPPPTITVGVTAATANEAGPTNGTFTLSRGSAEESPITVTFTLTGTAINGTDYVSIPTTATIPSGAASVDVTVTPVDDALLESNETVVLVLLSSSTYVIGSPSSGTVTIVSDDLAPDFVVNALTAPQTGGAGLSLQVSDTTANQGSGASSESTTSFYLSLDVFFDAGDQFIGSRTVPALAVGGTSAASTTVTLPETVTPGVYRIFAKADGPGQVTETNENNNLRSVSVRVGPDLAITAITAPSMAGAGGTISVTDTTTNQGGGTADPSETRFYLSSDYLLDATDTQLQGRAVATLAPGGSSTSSTTLTIPTGTATGLYYLFAKADGPDSVPEPVENNNTRYASVRIGPDLAITAFTAPSMAGAGGTISVTDTTANQGGGAAAASETRFYLSSNYLLDATDTQLQGRAVATLAPGSSSMASTTLTIPAGTATGLYYLFAKADGPDALAESVENNNTRYVTIWIGPDLIISTISAPTRAASGGTLAVTETTRNSGAGTAAPSRTAIYLSSNYLFDAADTRLTPDRSVDSLSANGFSTATTTVQLPSVAPGTWYLIARADDLGAVAESNETNNTRYMTILVGPDLNVTLVSAPTSVVAGSTISVTNTVRNSGVETAGPTVTRVYLSQNTVLDAADTFLGERTVGALGYNATSTGQTGVTIPTGLSGTYYLIAAADGAGAVAESNETNNTLWRAITINPQ